MVYLILILYIIFYSYLVQVKGKKTDYFVFFIPIGILLVLVLGLQNNVGTDYNTYLSLADGTKGYGWIESKSEVLFVYLIKIVKMLDNPQLIFIFAAIIQVAFLSLIAFEVKKIGYKLHNFFFLYFFLSLTFFNQFNGIRQYIAVYIIAYSIFKLRENKVFLFIFLVFLASLFHSSAIFCIAFILIRKLLKKRIPYSAIIIIMLGLVTLRFINLDPIYIKLLSYTKYSHYAHARYFGKLSIKGIITKIPKIIISMFSAYVIERKKDSLIYKDRFLLNMSYITIAVLILSFTSTMIWRFYQYLDLFIIFPVLSLMEDTNKRDYSILISLALIVMLVIKIIIIPQGEYMYKSILSFAIL